MHSDETDPLTPDERRQAVARILAAGVLRLRARAALPLEVPGPRILPENTANPLDVSADPRLSVPPG
jgi:hypothetical protein